MNVPTSQLNTFYGNLSSIKQTNHPQSRQAVNGLGSKGGTLSSQQSMMSKNDIIAKYMKSIGHQGISQSNQIPTTNKQPRQSSNGH